MTIVGFNFTKIEAEKKELTKGKIKINNNVSITDVGEKNISVGTDKQKILRCSFEFVSKYDPNVGMIKLIGNVLYMNDSKKVKEIMDGWKKDKKLPKELMASILNTVLNKCNVQALILSEQISLPSPIELPKIQQQKE
ncbi:hypothetical protein CL615_02370 [archaeon]|jgi:hypothetical protein|nr:hypothetical protein [archaeon]MDP6547720.1 hypothetical protein [Candidatus Woesearchaeota archaeon]|tara:strand:- start:16849 stop:17262 length:414 start_codon:yes stop_codon:yes gene_type:complete